MKPSTGFYLMFAMVFLLTFLLGIQIRPMGEQLVSSLITATAVAVELALLLKLKSPFEDPDYRWKDLLWGLALVPVSLFILWIWVSSANPEWLTTHGWPALPV